MATIEMSVNLDAIFDQLDNIQEKQIPFAVAMALTETAKDADRALKAQLHQKFDRPVRFTERAFSVTYAKKRKPVAVIAIRPIQYEYLKYQIDGGTRLPKKKKHPIPKGVKLNKFGNMPKGKIQKLLAKPNTFEATIKGVSGIWERGHYTKRGNWSSAGKRRSTAIKLLVRYVPKADYDKRYPYYEIIHGVVANRFNRNFDQAWRKALATAK